MALSITLLAFVLDCLLGDPGSWPHPVRSLGNLVSASEKTARRLAGEQPSSLRLAGAGLALFVVIASMAAASLALFLASRLSFFLLCALLLYMVYSAMCLKELYRQTILVERALESGDLPGARLLLSLVVGRDTADLSGAAIRRALIETLAENLSDGLTAPMFYLALGGPVLLWGYKAINTLDSMIGYKNERYIDLGRFAAKLDDAANFIPARLSALLIIASARLFGLSWRESRRVWRRDGHCHLSPNSGQPEAAMAGALGVSLGGPAAYGGVLHHKAFINAGGAEAGSGHVRAAERLMLASASLALILCLAFMALSGAMGWPL